jgi:UDP-N-acetylmuramoyl-L-alanine---L-glutamate ligase
MKIVLDFFTNKDIILIGSGRDSVATRQYLEKYSRAASYEYTNIDIYSATPVIEQLGSPDLSRAVIIKTPGVSGMGWDFPYLTSAQIFFDLMSAIPAKIIGITGTKGKTTTSALTNQILLDSGYDSRLVGNGGSSFLPYLEGATPETVFVAELSSYMLEDLRISPQIAVVTNLYQDHIDRHGNLDTYYLAKENIVKYQSAADYYIYNGKYPKLSAWGREYPSCGIDININRDQPHHQTKLIGAHNQHNIQMAVEVAQLLDIPEEQYLQTIAGFEPVKHRLQKVAVVNGVTYIDDGIASQPESAIAGLKAVSSNIGNVSVMLLGGQDRGYDFDDLMQAVCDHEVANLVLFPDTVKQMTDAMPKGYSPNILVTKDMIEAVEWASNQSQEGSVVLLSCGAPSYSIWKDFEDKGDQFHSAVASL